MNNRDSKQLPYFKYHALGNDYIVLRQADFGQLSPEEVSRICDRHFGIGSDGILLDTQLNASDPISVRIFNPDGGEAEKSGNGLRIFSRFLWDQGRVAQELFQIRTLGGDVQAQVLEGGAVVEVEMGTAVFLSEAIPMTGPSRAVLQEPLILPDGETLTISAASIGNPHCIVLSKHPSRALAERLGPSIENHPAFPRRTNVQFVAIRSPQHIQMEIWERGAGYTLASGSSASATAAVLRRLNLVDSRVRVEMPGGSLDISVASDYSVTMRGRVTRVAEGVLFAEALAELEGSSMRSDSAAVADYREAVEQPAPVAQRAL